ncbi:unnamed protein product, partial [Brassica oleracea var. botrytis]
SIALCVYVFGYTVQLGRAYSIATLVRSYYPSELNSYFSSRGEGTKGLVQFSDIGKQARDLLFTDYQQGLKASLNFDPYRIRLRSSVDAGGLSGGLVASFPDQSSSKVSLGYVHPNAIANFTTSFGLFRNPLFALSEVVGNHLWSLGFDASFDVTTQSFRSMDFASSLISDKFIASFNSYNRADLLKVYLYQSVMNSAYAVELSRQRSTNTSRISIGYEHRFGSEVLVKSRVDSNGTVAALFQYKWNPGTFYRLKQSLPAESVNTLRVCFLISKEIPGEVRDYEIDPREMWKRYVLIRGVHVGGMEEIKKLNDGGKLGEMLKGLPVCESVGACGCCGDPSVLWSTLLALFFPSSRQLCFFILSSSNLPPKHCF